MSDPQIAGNMTSSKLRSESVNSRNFLRTPFSLPPSLLFSPLSLFIFLSLPLSIPLSIPLSLPVSFPLSLLPSYALPFPPSPSLSSSPSLLSLSVFFFLLLRRLERRGEEEKEKERRERPGIKGEGEEEGGSIEISVDWRSFSIISLLFVCVYYCSVCLCVLLLLCRDWRSFQSFRTYFGEGAVPAQLRIFPE